jgi:prephenate dehydrogenase
MKHGKFDRGDATIAAACRDASLVILNVPPSQLREAFQLIGPALREGAVVLDLSPVKVPVLNWATELLPSNVRHLSCHLILHPEVSELGEPRADLFHGAVLCMTPTADTDEVAIKNGSDLARVLGARPYFMDPFEHDGLAAATEGMPGLVSAAVLLAATHARAWNELSEIAGSLFAHVTRGTTHSAVDFGAGLVYNRPDVLRWLDAFLGELKEVRQAVDAGDVGQLNRWFDEAIQVRDDWLAGKPVAPWNDQDALPGPPHELKRFDPLMPGWGQKG